MVLFGVGVIALVPIMLSDRAPALLRWLSRNIEEELPQRLRARMIGQLPEPDVAIHLLVYGGLAVLVALLAWSWWTLVLGQLLLFGGGIVVELSQGALTMRRSVETSDMIGNAVGQVTGFVVAFALIGAWHIWARWRHGRSGRRSNR